MTPKKVDPARSNAGPGCWQCAICDYINSDDRNSCRRCDDQSKIVPE